MARIRSIKQDLGQNEKLSRLPIEAHFFAALLLPYADDEGYFNANPKLVHAALCPLRELLVSVPEILRSLTEIGYIETFTGTDGKQYGHIVNFLEHQRVSHASKSKIKTFRSPLEEFAMALEPLRPELKGIELKGIEGGVAPEGLHPLNYARRLLEEIKLPATYDNLQVVAAAIEMEIGGGKTGASAYKFVLAGTLDARECGVEINRFFFADAKYRSAGTKSTPREKADPPDPNRKCDFCGAMGAFLMGKGKSKCPECIGRHV